MIASSRIGGIAGFGFLAGLFLQNAILLQGAPLPGADAATLRAFYTDAATRIALAVGLVALNVPFVITFVQVLAGRLAATKDALWGRVAGTAVAVMAGTFLVASALNVALVAGAPRVDDATLLTLASLHDAAFALVGAPLGLLVAALALGTRDARLVPGWMTWVGLAGGALLVAGGALAVATVAGAPSVFLNLGGFLCWAVFLGVASWRLLRESPASEAVTPSAAGA